MICGVCGKEYSHYGGIHAANMLDFRWEGFARESVSVERIKVCNGCMFKMHSYILRMRAAEFGKRVHAPTIAAEVKKDE